MSRYLLAGAVVLCLGTATSADPETVARNDGPPPEQVEPMDRQRKVQQVRPGMTPDEVRRLLGPPERVARQILYRRYLEQWIYDPPLSLRIGWDCLSGQDPQVQTVQATTPEKP